MGMKTPVIFRKWASGEIIALFPTIPANATGSDCTCYSSIGQHGAADYQHVVAMTTLAKRSESNDLAKELKGLGYDLKRCLKTSKWHRKAFRASIECFTLKEAIVDVLEVIQCLDGKALTRALEGADLSDSAWQQAIKKLEAEL